MQMKLKSKEKNFEIYYYVNYLTENYLNNTNDLVLSLELYNKNEYNTKKINLK